MDQVEVVTLRNLMIVLDPFMKITKFGIRNPAEIQIVTLVRIAKVQVIAIKNDF